MTTRYQQSQIEDVAGLLGRYTYCEDEGCESCDGQRVMVGRFADLFATDNPPFCRTCDADHSIFYAGEGLHDYEGGFDRKRFLTACGLESES